MILSGNNLHRRFKHLLKTHTHVDIATAWAAGGEHLQALADAASREHAGVKVRAIVGISGRATRPDALEDLSRITVGDLRIVPEGNRLFHPKLYLFGRNRNGIVTRRAWIGSANFTNMGFGGHSNANEEIMLEVGPGESADALAAWFHERWDRCRMDGDVSEVIRRYTEDWKRSPRDQHIQQMVSGPVSHRRDLLDDAHRPLTLKGYRQALEKCEKTLRDQGWEIFDARHRSYVRVIARRRELLLGDARWSDLDLEFRTQLKGGAHHTTSDWWGLMGRIRDSHWATVLQHETKIRASLGKVTKAHDTEFPDIALAAMQELTAIKSVGTGTATLLLTLARPDRLLSLNKASSKGLGALSRNSRWTLGKPENYRKLLQWLYGQPWYADSPPADEDLLRIWRFRAALVDAFVYEWT